MSAKDIARLEEARLIGLDWGTTSLRAYLFGKSGEILAENSAPSGVMHLERFCPVGAPDAPRENLFEAALEDICRDWPAEVILRLPVIACGMVGSTAGWKEAAYLKTPAGAEELARALTNVERAKGSTVRIVPGVCASGLAGSQLPEIMRGEETQIAGILSQKEGGPATRNDHLLVGLPGTHSKWVQVRDGKIVSFATFVTGELYGLLASHSVIAKTQKKASRFEEAAFKAGLRLSQRPNAEAAGGLLSTIFSTRSRRVLGELKEEEQPDYLSGLLIGEELAGVERMLLRERCSLQDFASILLAGERDLCVRYQAACNVLGWPVTEMIENATVRGLWSVAQQAGMVRSET